MLDRFLDNFFTIFHTLFAVFNVFGWIWTKTRKINLLLLLLTASSWFILGIWYGIGYCPLTEYHWQVRYRLGYHVMPYSYIKFLLDTWTGLDWNSMIVDTVTALLFSSALIISVFLNLKDWKKERAS